MAGSELMRNHRDAMQTYQTTKEDKDCDLVLGHLGLEPVGVHHQYDGRSVRPWLQAWNENSVLLWCFSFIKDRTTEQTYGT